MDCAPVVGTDRIRVQRFCTFFDSQGEPSRIAAPFARDTPPGFAIDDAGDQRSQITSSLIGTPQF